MKDIASSVRATLEALGPVCISGSDDRLVYFNQGMGQLHKWTEANLGERTLDYVGPATLPVLLPHWEEGKATQQVLYTPEVQSLDTRGGSLPVAGIGTWIDYDDSLEAGRIRISVGVPLAEKPTERSLRNTLGIAVQSVQFCEMRFAYEQALVEVRREADQLIDNVRVRICHALRGMNGNPEEELARMRAMLSDMAVMLDFHKLSRDEPGPSHDS